MEYSYEKPIGKRILNLIILVVIYELVTLIYNIPVSLISWSDTPAMEVVRDLVYYGAGVIVVLIFMKLVKCEPDMLEALTGKMSGNRAKTAFAGLAAGALLCLIVFVFSFILPGAVFDGAASNVPLVILSFAAVLFQASLEELGLRVFFYQSFRRTFKSPWVAIILTSLMFGYNHMLLDPINFVNYTVAGLAFALMVYELDSPWCAILYHFGWNYMGLLTGQYYETIYLCRAILPETNETSLGIAEMLPQLVLNILLVIVLLRLGKKRSKSVE